MNKNLNFDVKLTDVQPTDNPLFSKAKAYVMYHGDNRNMSSMKKQIVENALPTLVNCPVIGEYNESLEDFRGHGGKIEISSEGIKYVQTTRPYGVIPESTTIAWETITELDGSTHEYLTCDVFLWTSRYPEAESVILNGKGQSMEISQVEGDTREDGFFEINSFVFSALCILGDDVEPCFESSAIKAYTLDKDQFKRDFELMIRELKGQPITSNQEQGGAVMQNKKFESTENVEDGVVATEVVKDNPIVVEDGQTENFENHVGEENSDGAETHTEDFALTAEQTKAEIRRVLRTQTYKDDWGYDNRSYWYIDHDESMVYAEDNKNDYLVSLPYSKNGDALNIDFVSSKRVKVVYSPLEEGTLASNFEIISIEKNEFELEKAVKEKEAEFTVKLDEKENTITALNTELSATKEKFATLETEANELKVKVASYESEKSKEEKEAIFEQFSGGLTEDEMKPVRDEIDNLSVADIKTKLNEIFTTKNLPQFKKSKFNADKDVDVVIDIAKKDTFKSSRYYV